MELMKEKINFGEDAVLVMDGCNFTTVAKFLVQNELKYPFYWGNDTEVSYETKMEEILNIVWNDPDGFSIEGLEHYYGVLERELIMKVKRAALRQISACIKLRCQEYLRA